MEKGRWALTSAPNRVRRPTPPNTPRFRTTHCSKPSEGAFIPSKFQQLLNFFRVKLAKSKKNGRFYAIKIIKRNEIERVNLNAFKKILSNEVNLLESMDHPHIIKMVEYNTSGEVWIKEDGRATEIFFIVLELVEEGDLFSFVKA
jgi:serine/threonine protein kinase